MAASSSTPLKKLPRVVDCPNRPGLRVFCYVCSDMRCRYTTSYAPPCFLVHVQAQVQKSQHTGQTYSGGELHGLTSSLPIGAETAAKNPNTAEIDFSPQYVPNRGKGYRILTVSAVQLPVYLSRIPIQPHLSSGTEPQSMGRACHDITQGACTLATSGGEKCGKRWL